jgi:hypothetical protein
MPLYAYIDHLRRTRERYGEAAARLDLAFTLEVRRLKIEAQNEALRQAGNG